MLIGMESQERLDLLLSLTSIRSEPQKDALKRHFVEGVSFEIAALLSEIQPSNFQRAIAKIEAVEAIVRQIEEIDFAVINQKTDK